MFPKFKNYAKLRVNTFWYCVNWFKKRFIIVPYVEDILIVKNDQSTIYNL